MEELRYVFQYLSKEDIEIEKAEFQIQTYADYSNLIVIVDTLSFLIS